MHSEKNWIGSTPEKISIVLKYKFFSILWFKAVKKILWQIIFTDRNSGFIISNNY